MLGKSRRHFRRYREIAGVLARHGFGLLVDKIGVADTVGHHRGLPAEQAAPVHLRESLEELGPTFVKLGQLLSTRPDIMPEAYIVELAKLQDTAPTLPASEVHRVIEQEFGAKVGELYAEFDEIPFAAASLAQVHRAKLNDGTSVIVKIQRPRIREQVETDIEILYQRARSLEGHWERARTYGATEIVDEFATTILEELDYIREARNTDILRDKLAKLQLVRVPKVYWELTTTRVLTLEEITGIKITDLPAHPLPGVDPKDVANRLVSAFLEQIFVDGFFHADPHPGNIMVADSGEIGLVDCGQVGRLDAETRAAAVRILLAFEREDTRALADEVMYLGITQADVDVRAFTADMGKILRRYYDLPARSVNMGQILARILDTSGRHKIRLPVVFTVLGKVMGSIDGICRQLDPDFNFTHAARDYAGRAVKSELKAEGIAAEIYRAAAGMKTLMLSLPDQLERIFRKAAEGCFRIEFKHLGLDEVSSSFRAGANRIAMALIVGSIIIGSSLVVLAGKGPTSLFSLPLLGVLGYVLATVFGVWLVVSIVRSGRR
jgi:ubiquinone biosynthesis protein